MDVARGKTCTDHRALNVSENNYVRRQTHIDIIQFCGREINSRRRAQRVCCCCCAAVKDVRTRLGCWREKPASDPSLSQQSDVDFPNTYIRASVPSSSIRFVLDVF